MVTYFDLKQGYILEKDDKLIIHGITHTVRHGVEYYLIPDKYTGNNAKIFELFGLSCKEKNDWAKKFGGLGLRGQDSKSFPEMYTLEALTEFVIDIYERPLYKDGDEVRIVKCEGVPDEYPAGFTSCMQDLSGKTYKIKSSRLCEDGSIACRAKYNGDPHWYKLEGDIFTWSSAHFTRVVSSDKATITEEEKKPEVKDCPPKYKVGDRVKVKKRVGDGDDYPFDFVDEMLEYQGKIYTVKEVYLDILSMTEHRKFFDGDRTRYYLDTGDGQLWSFSSPMLEPASCDKIKKEVDHDHIRYQDLKDGYILETGDKLLLKGLLYHVASNRKRFWLSNGSLDEIKIFNKLGISNIKGFADKYGECHIVGLSSFPEMNSAEELTKLVIALYEYKPVNDAKEKLLPDVIKAVVKTFPSGSSSGCETEETGIRLPKRSGNLNIQL